VNFRQRQELHL